MASIDCCGNTPKRKWYPVFYFRYASSQSNMQMNFCYWVFCGKTYRLHSFVNRRKYQTKEKKLTKFVQINKYETMTHWDYPKSLKHLLDHGNRKQRRYTQSPDNMEKLAFLHLPDRRSVEPGVSEMTLWTHRYTSHSTLCHQQ